GLRARLSAANLEFLTGRFHRAAEQTQAIAAEATAEAYDEIAGDALELGSAAYGELSDPRRFESLAQAYYLAAPTDGERAARRAVGLARQHAYAQHVTEARRWLRHAEAAGQRAPGKMHTAAMTHVRGLLPPGDRNGLTSLELFRRARVELGELSSTEHELSWLVNADLMGSLLAANRLDDARVLGQTLRGETVAQWGPSHPRLAGLQMNLAKIAGRRGDAEGAIEMSKQAVALSEEVYGSVNLRTAAAYLALGGMYHRFEKPEDARRSLRRGLRAHGSTPTQYLALLQRGLGELHAEADEPELAEPFFRETIRIGEQVWPRDLPQLAVMRREWAESLLETGAFEQAAAELSRLRDSPAGTQTRTRFELARIASRTGRLDEAIEGYRRAWLDCEDKDETWCLLSGARLASTYVHEGRLGEAREQLERMAGGESSAGAAIALAQAELAWAEGDKSRARALTAGVVVAGRHYASRLQRRDLQAWRQRHPPLSNASKRPQKINRQAATSGAYARPPQ
ncbi:MAG: tetratricopeptide repeat protein, partial [Nannocystaceae bacterium]|nr:tetratricopeptide repeat protein [Nannocystaceae bacterium]